MPARSEEETVVVFDLGGVVVRWSDRWVFDRVADGLGLPRARVARCLAREADALMAGRGGLGEFWRRSERSLGARIPPRLRRQWTGLFAARASIDPAVAEWIRALQRDRVRVACLSNTDRSHIRDFPDRRLLARFAPSLYSYRLGATKPHRAAFDRARRALGVPARRLVLIDDRPENVRAARRAGWRAIRFLSPAQARRALERALVRRGETS
ncbi:MAG: HAD-IA family hydrolase [Thermoplasmata archaeon]